MGFDKKTFRALKNLSMISQLAISLLTPCFLCILACNWLINKFGIGNWLMVFGIIFGLAAGVKSVSVFAKGFIRDAQKSQQEYEDRFK